MQKYEPLCQLGDGTFGVVIKARVKATGEYVAIKKMKQAFPNWDECLKLPEVVALKKLKASPHIIRLKEVFREGHTLYFVFECMDGDLLSIITGKSSIAKSIMMTAGGSNSSSSSASHHDNNNNNNNKGIPLPKVKNYLFQILQGIAHLHRAGMYHRDMKPENILISSSRTNNNSTGKNDGDDEQKNNNGSNNSNSSGGEILKIADLGLVKEIRGNPIGTEYVSTRWYRSPEQLLQDKRYSSPIDIFAIGCIAFEMAAGFPLFPGKSENDQLFKVFSVLGTPNQNNWADGLAKMNLMRFSMPQTSGKDLASICPKLGTAPQLVDLLLKMMNINPTRRISASAALQHPFFAGSSVGVSDEIATLRNNFSSSHSNKATSSFSVIGSNGNSNNSSSNTCSFPPPPLSSQQQHQQQKKPILSSAPTSLVQPNNNNTTSTPHPNSSSSFPSPPLNSSMPSNVGVIKNATTTTTASIKSNQTQQQQIPKSPSFAPTIENNTTNDQTTTIASSSGFTGSITGSSFSKLSALDQHVSLSKNNENSNENTTSSNTSLGKKDDSSNNNNNNNNNNKPTSAKTQQHQQQMRKKSISPENAQTQVIKKKDIIITNTDIPLPPSASSATNASSKSKKVTATKSPPTLMKPLPSFSSTPAFLQQQQQSSKNNQPFVHSSNGNNNTTNFSAPTSSQPLSAIEKLKRESEVSALMERISRFETKLQVENTNLMVKNSEQQSSADNKAAPVKKKKKKLATEKKANPISMLIPSLLIESSCGDAEEGKAAVVSEDINTARTKQLQHQSTADEKSSATATNNSNTNTNTNSPSSLLFFKRPDELQKESPLAKLLGSSRYGVSSFASKHNTNTSRSVVVASGRNDEDAENIVPEAAIDHQSKPVVKKKLKKKKKASSSISPDDSTNTKNNNNTTTTTLQQQSAALPSLRIGSAASSTTTGKKKSANVRQQLPTL